MRLLGLLALVAVVAIVVLVLLLWHPNAPTAAIAPAPVTDAPSLRSAELESAPSMPATIEGNTQPRTARTSAVSEDGTSAIGRYEFDVTFVMLDMSGRPRADTTVGFALERQRPNDMAFSDAKGERRVTWRSDFREIDGVFGPMGSTAVWSRVHLVAGRPNVLRSCGETLHGPLELTDGDVGAHTAGSAEVLFGHDPEGNGVFVDCDLMIREMAPSSHSIGRAGSLTVHGMGRSGTRKIAMSTIECVVQTVDGRAAANVPLRLFGGSSRGENARTDADGHFSLTRPSSGSVDIEIGGGIFPLQRKAFELAAGNQTWNVQLSRLPLVSGKLIDPESKPLAGWHVQARQDEPPFGFLQSCDTDAEGKFVLGIEHGDRARLLVKPPESDDRPAVLLANHVAAGAEQLVLAVREPMRRVSAKWHFDAPTRFPGAVPIARVIRNDSGECNWIYPQDVSETTDDRVRWTFDFDRALPGDYEIMNFGPAGRSVLGVRLENEDEELGNIPLDPTMMVVLVPDDVGESEMWSAQLFTSAQGVRVRSNTTMESGNYLVPAGDAELVIATDASTKPLRRMLHGNAGERIEVPFSSLRRAEVLEPILPR